MAETDSSGEKAGRPPVGSQDDEAVVTARPATPQGGFHAALPLPLVAPSRPSVPAASSSQAPVALGKPSSSKHPAAADTADTTASNAPVLPLPVIEPPEPAVEPARDKMNEDVQAAAAAAFTAASSADDEPRPKSAPSLAELAAKANVERNERSEWSGAPSRSEGSDESSERNERSEWSGAPSRSEGSGTRKELEARVVAQAKEPAARAAKSSAKMPAAGSPSTTAPTDARPLAAYELVARSARLGDLVALTNRIVTDAARARVSDWAFTSKVTASADEMKLTHEDADTRFGNALDVLGTGGEGTAEKALACALWAHAVAESPRARTEDEDRVAGDVLWLATHTAFDATSLLDRALGEDAAELWSAIADRVRRIERGKGGALGRGEAIVGCAALAASGADRAKTLCSELASEVKDPVLLRVLATGAQTTPDEVRLEGELLPAPRGPVVTTILAFTGILFAVHAVRLVARLALAYRRPTEVSLSESGVRVKTRTELLGRTLREREHVILRSGLVRVVREVRFPRAAFYAGLLALALGSYVGVRAFADGVRAASPSLLVVGLLIVALGIGADFLLGSLIPGSRGRCRVAFIPRTGPTLCIGDVDARRADDALARSLGKR